MQKIDEQITWYEDNANSYYDDIIRIELKKINDLYDQYDGSVGDIFVKEIIDSFCKIVEMQREKINDLEMEVEMDAASRNCGQSQGGFAPMGHAWMKGEKPIFGKKAEIKKEDFENDKELQEAFVAFCLEGGKSSYTINDYCSRIKNVWKQFQNDSKEGKVPQEILVSEEEIIKDFPLLNVYNHTDEINCYISGQIAATDGGRNWANARAAFNKLDDFKMRNAKL